MRRFLKAMPLLVFAFAIANGCKKQEGSTGGASGTFPERAGGESDATSMSKVGVLGKNGGKRLVIDLEKVPEYGSANLWACYQLPADDFVFGKAVCTSDNSRSVDITAKNVDFTCEVNPDFGVQKAKDPLSTDHCESFDIYSFVFKPTLELKVAE